MKLYFDVLNNALAVSESTLTASRNEHYISYTAMKALSYPPNEF
jgi:hypothetical protein